MGKTDMNVMMGTKVPALRFKGFSGDWVESKLGDYGLIQSGTGFPNDEQGGCTGVPFYKVSDMNLDGNETLMKAANNYVSLNQIENNNWNVFEDTPAVIFAKVGAAIMLNRKRLVDHPFLIDNNMMSYIFDANWDTYYGKTLFETINLPRYVQVGALPSYNATDIRTIPITIPDSTEQQQIGQTFKTVDALIQAEQDKLEQLESLKKSFLQKMFPKKGATVPELRFDGFSGDWTEKKLGDVVDDGLISLGRGKVIAKTEMSKDNSGYPVYSSSSLNNGLMGYTEEYNFDKEMITWSIDGGGYLFYRPEHKFSITNVSGYLIADELSFDYKYLSESLELQRPRFEFDYQNKAHPSVIRSLYSVYLTTLEEQVAIGQFFKTFDELIAKQEEKVENGKLLKKALLQKMFV